MKCSVYIATSANGFIARPNGDINWLHRPEYEDAGTLGLGMMNFIATFDTIVVMPSTFEKALSIDEWLYKGVEVIGTNLKKVTLSEETYRSYEI